MLFEVSTTQILEDDYASSDEQIRFDAERRFTPTTGIAPGGEQEQAGGEQERNCREYIAP